MDLRQHLEEELSKDFQLLKQLEDKQRYEDDPRQISKWDAAIKEVKQRIHIRETERKSLELSAQRFPKNFPAAGNALISVPPTKAIEVFFSYAQEDEKQLIQLEKQLRLLERQGVIQTWHNRKISAGKEWQNEIDTHLDTASVILLLISTNFIDSSYCWDVEVKRAMERHDAKESRVIPVIIDFVDWKSAPFGKLQHLPKGDKPIKGQNREKAFRSVADGIREAVKELAEN